MPTVEQTDFSGKSTFSENNNLTQYWTLQENGRINLTQSTTADSTQQWNTYGELTTGYWLQAGNWSYLVFDDEQQCYVANGARNNSQVAVFRLTQTATTIEIVELVGSETYSVGFASNELTRRPVEQVSELNNQFTRTEITPSLAEIQMQHSAMECNLRGVWLQQAEVERIAFLGADLSFADLTQAKLAGAGMIDITAEHAIFDYADVDSRTSFQGARLPYASLIGISGQPNLNGIQANEAIFNDSNLSEAVCNNAVLTGSRWLNANLNQVRMGSVDFTGADLSSCDCIGAYFQEVNFTSANLIGTNFSTVDLTNVNFTSANLTNCDFTQATSIIGVDFSEAILIGANLENLDLRTVTVTRGTNFTQANMKAVNLTAQTLTGISFIGTNLESARLDNTEMSETSLVNANLSFATVTGNVSFISANLANAKLEGTQLPGAQFGALQTVGSLALSSENELHQQQLPTALLSLLETKKQPINRKKIIIEKRDQDWHIHDKKDHYLLQKQHNEITVLAANSGDSASLVNAFMFNANLKEANLYAVDLSGAHWYGASANAEQTNMELVNLTNANVASMNFTQATLYGVDLSFANMIGSNFTNAKLRPTVGNKRSSFAFASVQGAIFDLSDITQVNMTNSGVSSFVDHSSTLLNGEACGQIAGSFEAVLNEGFITQSLADALASLSIQVQTQDTLLVISSSSQWLIRPSTNNPYVQYVLVLEQGQTEISVYGQYLDTTTEYTQVPVLPLIGVPLFTLEPGYEAELNAGILSAELQTLFNDNGYGLVDMAKTAVMITDRYWGIRNLDPDLYVKQSGYGQFWIFAPDDDSEITVYGGAPLLVMRNNANNELEKTKVYFGTTQFNEAQWDGATITPSGLDYALLGEVTLQQLMTPGLPPTPPKCIPSPITWC